MLAGNVTDPSSRGLKRSRSPEHDYAEYLHGGHDGKILPDQYRVAHVAYNDSTRDPIDSYQIISLIDNIDDNKPRKRGRPPKTPRTSGDYTGHVDSLPTPASQVSQDMAHTPLMGGQGITNQAGAVPQTSPPRTTPQKTTTLKALPTVRDHTTDQLGPGGDEYIARDSDESGEKKVDDMGYLQGGREYKLRTFTLPGRGNKLFMLATECARTLQYRDSYLLFNKNRSLFKIIANAKEKEELVLHEILPYSYRSRQIAIVTARSMFRQFGSRVIKDGRRVRDDYWEAKAIKQGFTEDDPAGEKRPGATRAREAAAAAQQEQLNARQLNAYGDVIYASVPGYNPVSYHTMAPNPGMLPTFDYTHDPKYRDINRPRQDLTGAPFIDMSRPSSETEMAGQSTHAAEFSRTVNQQANYRKGIVQSYWGRPHDPPVTTPPADVADVTTGRDFESPRFGNDISSTQASVGQAATQAMNPPSFPLQQNPLASPSRQSSMGSGYGRDSSSQFTPQHQQFQRSSSNLSISQSASQPSGMQYGSGFSPHQLQQQQAQGWGGPPPQPSPSLHRMNSGQFAGMNQSQMQSPMPGHGSPHASHQMQPPQVPIMHHQGSNMSGQQLYGPGAGLQAMSAGNYPGLNPLVNRGGMYAGLNQSQFMQQQGGQQSGQQSWTQPGQGGSGAGGAGQWGGQFQ